VHVAAQRSSDDRSSEASSVRSSVSGSDSLPGSAANSPCESPQPSSTSKSRDAAAADPGASSSHHCRYFVMKAANSKMFQTAEQKSVWGTTAVNEKKIAAAFAVRCHVLLLLPTFRDRYTFDLFERAWTFVYQWSGRFSLVLLTFLMSYQQCQSTERKLANLVQISQLWAAGHEHYAML